MKEQGRNSQDQINEEEIGKLLEKEFRVKIIPDELNDIRGLIYGVISKGVHELPENDCLRLFPAARFIIDSLIEEKIQQREKKERLSAFKKQFSEIGK